jgi:hypothetical protein
LDWIAAERGCAVMAVRELHRGHAWVYGARCADGAAYVVKLASPESAARERWWYAGAPGSAGAPSRWLDASLAPGTLLFAVDPAACDARDYAVAHQRLPAELPVRIARELIALHALERDDAPPARVVPPQAWRTDALGSDAAALARALVPAAAEALRAVPSGGALVHGDVRWENVVIAGDGGAVALIDWENCGRDAPAWDVGCLLAAYAAYLARVVALAGETAATAALRAIVAAHGASAWNTYRDGAADARAPGFLRAVLSSSAIRLAESALVPGPALRPAERLALLAAAQGFFTDPAGSAARWYGIRDSLA